MKKEDQIVKEAAQKKFVKVVIAPKISTKDSKRQTTNGTNMNC